jgi:hypothetical protein
MTNHTDEGVEISSSTPVEGVLIAAEIDGAEKYVIVGGITAHLLERPMSAADARAIARALNDAADVIDQPR